MKQTASMQHIEKRATELFLSLRLQSNENASFVQLANDISFSSVLVELPAKPLDKNKLEKLRSDFLFQLKWQNQIFAIMNGLPKSALMEIQFPTPPYFPKQMNDFVALMKEHNVKQSSFQNLSQKQAWQQAKIQWLLNRLPAEDKPMRDAWKKNLLGLFKLFQKVSIKRGQEDIFSQQMLASQDDILSLLVPFDDILLTADLNQSKRFFAFLSHFSYDKPGFYNHFAESTDRLVNPRFYERYKSGGYIYLQIVAALIKSKHATVTEMKSLVLTELDLTSLPAEIGLLSNLESMHLQGNRLSQLPDTFANLSALTEISLARNVFQELPPQLTDLPNIKALNLSHNNLSVLSSHIGNFAQLQDLNLSNNALKNLPKELKNCSKLWYLNLSGNNIQNLTPLTPLVSGVFSLNLSQNEIHDIYPLLNNIDSFTQLKNLDVSNNNIAYFPDNVFSEFASREITSLNIDGNPDMFLLEKKAKSNVNIFRLVFVTAVLIVPLSQMLLQFACDNHYYSQGLTSRTVTSGSPQNSPPNYESICNAESRKEFPSNAFDTLCKEWDAEQKNKQQEEK